jgi:hypothetical protein
MPCSKNHDIVRETIIVKAGLIRWAESARSRSTVATNPVCLCSEWRNQARSCSEEPMLRTFGFRGTCTISYLALQKHRLISVGTPVVHPAAVRPLSRMVLSHLLKAPMAGGQSVYLRRGVASMDINRRSEGFRSCRGQMHSVRRHPLFSKGLSPGVEDAALLMGVLAGYDPIDPFALDESWNFALPPEPRLSEWRIA